MGLEEIVYGLVLLISAASTYTAYKQAQEAKKSLQKLRGLTLQIRATAQPRRIIYGRRCVGGLEDFIGSSGDNNEYIHYIFIWGEGPCQAREKLLFDGIEVPLNGDGDCVSGQYAGLVSCRDKLGGDDNLTPIAEAVAQMPGWGATDLLLGTAYSWVRLKYDQQKFPNGVPNISAVMQGRNDIYDPRDSTYGYTNNVARCFNHYLCLRRLGPGIDYETEMDEDLFIDCTNVCDQDVDLSLGGTEKRYTYDGVVDLSSSAEEIITSFREAMGGYATYVSGRWKMYAGAYITPTFEITQDMIISPVTLRTKNPKANNLNTVKGVYVNEATQWTGTNFIAFVDTSAKADDGEELVQEVDYNQVNSPMRCRRLAKILEKKARLARTVSFEMHVEGLRAVPGVPIMLTLPTHEFSVTPMEVIEWGMTVANNEVRIAVTLREIAPAVYDWDSAEDLQSSVRVGTPPVVNPQPGNPGNPNDGNPNVLQHYSDFIGTPSFDVVLSFRNRAGTASLCGYEEYADVSSPPKKYRQKNFDGGTITDCQYDGGPTDCSGGANNNADSNQFNGYTFFASDTCEEDTSNFSLIGRIGTSGCSTSSLGISSAPKGGTNETLTATTRLVEGTDVCYIVGGGFAYRTTGSFQETLSVEDTEDDAITRFEAANDWPPDWNSCEFLPDPDAWCAVAIYDARTTGFSFDVQEAQVLVEKTGLVSGASYRIQLDIWIGDPMDDPSDYVLYDTIEIDVEADSTGTVSEIVDIPIVRGSHTTAHRTCRLLVL